MNCPECGLNLALVGRVHRCVPRVVNQPVVASPNADAKPSPNTRYSRNARWRQKNRETYNAGQRELMRKRRAQQKD